MSKLDIKREKFLLGIVQGKPQGQAYLDAGFKCKNPAVASACANRLLKNAKVQARLKVLREGIAERAAEKAGISKAWVIERLVENVNRAMQAEAVLDPEGKPTGEYKYQGQVANRALELVGKELGMFIDRKEVGAAGEFARMSDAELDDWLAEHLPLISADSPSDMAH